VDTDIPQHNTCTREEDVIDATKRITGRNEKNEAQKELRPDMGLIPGGSIEDNGMQNWVPE